MKVKQANYSPQKAYDFYSVRDLKDIKPESDFMIFLIPKVDENVELYFTGKFRIFLILKTPDVAGRNYYEIFLEDTLIDRNIGISEYFIAFLLDALLFPFWMIMLVSW